MALAMIYRCMCGHTMVEHCDEDSFGLFHSEDGCKKCSCKFYGANTQDPEVLEILTIDEDGNVS